MNSLLSIKHNPMKIGSISDFSRIKGGLCGGVRNVYFVRIVGYYDALLKDISEMDSLLSQGNASAYYRVDALPKQLSPDDIVFYSEKYEQWTDIKKLSLKNSNGNSSFEEVLGESMSAVLNTFSSVKASVSETIKRNFCIKLMFWLDYLLDASEISWNERITAKVAASNVSSLQDYLFYCFLTLLGFDVLLIQCECDIEGIADKMGFSYAVSAGDKKPLEIPKYIKPEKGAKAVIPSAPAERSGNAVVKIPERNMIRNSPVQAVSSPMINTSQRREKTLEELARLASSVVMIGIHDGNGKAIGSGSGIMIGRDGFILTNNHVANGGRFYSVKIEDDDNIYKTDEVIKYNSLQDLAIIRIDRTLSPIPLYDGRNGLVRGQRVVAIGSPLGLFNTVSDGIISGFRKINSVDMIQFTAPISHGSSGGAVLNMNGELIGISTAGIDEGQNINLAMGYECISLFVKGFI